MDEQRELKKEVLDFLHRNFIMSIAVSKDNKPSTSILLYYVDEKFNFYFATHTDSYKALCLKVNPKISLAVWQFSEMLIQADGEVSEIVDNTEKLAVIDHLADSAAKKAEFWPPILRIKGDGYVVFKIKPFWLRKLDLKKDTISSIDSPLIEIKL